MKIIFLLFAVGAGLHAWSYGGYIKARDNKTGALGINALVIVTVLLTLYWSIR